LFRLNFIALQNVGVIFAAPCITTKCLARSAQAGKKKNYFTNHLCLTERKMAIKKGVS
jgi:hypothetical protein